MKKLLANKNVFITGTNRGIGQAMLQEFAANGANVWAHARTLTPEFTNECLSISEQHNVAIWPICFDMTDFEAMKAAVKQIMASKMPVDALVNNAGITHNSLFQMTRLEDVRQQMEVNFLAPYQLTQYIAKLMVRNKKGSIVNMASSAALDGNSGKSAYGASKAALIAMTKSIAEELGKSGVRANCIAPGVTDTDMLQTMPDYVIQDVINSSALQRLGRPCDIAQTAVFLVSDLSAYITGQVIRVDGGMQ